MGVLRRCWGWGQAGFLEEEVCTRVPTHLLEDPEHFCNLLASGSPSVRGGGWSQSRPGVPH